MDNARWGHGVHVIGHLGTVLRHFGRKVALSLTRTIPAAFQDLPRSHVGLMQLSQILGKGPGRCVPWMLLSRLGVGANTGDMISPQLLHAFRPD